MTHKQFDRFLTIILRLSIGLGLVYASVVAYLVYLIYIGAR